MYGPLDMVTLTGEKVLSAMGVVHGAVKRMGDRDRQQQHWSVLPHCLPGLAAFGQAPLLQLGWCLLPGTALSTEVKFHSSIAVFHCFSAQIKQGTEGRSRTQAKGAWMGGPHPWPVLLLISVFIAVFDPDSLSFQVDIHIMTQPPSGEWVYFDTEISNSSGRISYVIPENRRLGIGVYPVKMVVR